MATRREQVLLELEDQFTVGIVRAAAATKVLSKELDGLSGRSVQTSRDTDRVTTSLRNAGMEADRTSSKFRRTSSDLNQFTGRLGLLIRAAAVLGPALVPIGAAAIPAVVGLTAGLGAAVGAAGVAILALNGVGDALKALDEYQLTPTQANLDKLNETLDALGPTASNFARYLDSIEPELKSLQEAARDGLLPGAAAGIDALLTNLPQLRRLIRGIGDELGTLATQAGQNLAGPQFVAFFDYLETDAAPTLRSFAVATGNVVEGIGNMLVAFAPLTRDFTGGLVGVTGAFADWSAALDDNADFQAFLDYLRATGPQVAETLGQIAVALGAIAEAAAPVGALLLPALTAVAKAVEVIAESDLGTPLMAGVAAMSALTLASSAWAKISASSAAAFVAAQGRATASIIQTTTAQDRARMSVQQLAAAERQRTARALGGAGRVAAVLAGLTIASTGAGDSLGVTNTASMALMGSFAGPWGAAIGGAVGLTLDLAAANDSLESAIRGADDAIRTMDVSSMQAQLEALNQQIDDFAEKQDYHFSFNPLKAISEGTDFYLSNTSELASGTREAAEAKREELEASIKAAEANDRYAQSALISGRNAGYSASEIRGMTEAMEEQRKEAASAFDAVTRYAQALIDARKQAEKSNEGIRLTNDLTRKQRLEVIENRTALAGLRDAWNSQGDAVANSVPKWRKARDEFIQTAMDMGATAKEAGNLADKVLEIPKSRMISIEMRGGSDALSELARIKRQAEDVAGQYRISFIVTQSNAINKGYDPTTGIRRADGGTIPGQRRPYRDKVLAYLAPGEEVITNRNGEADRFRADRAMGRIPAYASGGTVARMGAGGTPFFPDILSGLSHLLDGINDLSRHELRERERLLTRRERLEDRELAQAEAYLDEQREQLHALRDARRDFMQSVTSNFRTDVFGGVDFEQAWAQGLLGSGFSNALSAFAQQQQITNGTQGEAYVASDYLQAFVATLTPDQIAAYQAQVTVGQLDQDAANADAFESVLALLQDMGLTGGAYAELAASGNLAQAQMYLQMGPDFVQRLMESFAERNESLRNLGASVGNAQFGADIRDQLKETRHAVRIAQESRDSLRAIEAAQRDIAQRLQQLEQNGPERTGRAVGQAVNNAVGHGQRRG